MFLLFMALVAVASQTVCRFNIAGSTYDVSSLVSTTPYIWSDTRNNDTSSYTYTFNVCGAVPPGTVPANCGTDDPSTVSALSQRVDNQACQPLGLFSAAAPPTYALIDEYNPSYGFNLSYASPAPSSDGCTRSFHLIFRCGYDDWTPAGQAQRTLITETFNCQYETYTWTKKGCPLECPIGSNGGLCSNLGICGFDSGLGSSRCFCDDGYISADCSKPSNPVPAGAITAAFFGGSLLAAAGLLGFGYFRLRYLKYTQEAASAGEGFYGLAAE